VRAHFSGGNARAVDEREEITEETKMSTRAEDRGDAFRDNVAYRAASKAASTFDERVHRGADVAANAAHQTAERVGKASYFLEKKSQYLRDRASGIVEIARRHPIYAVMAVGILGLGLGLALRAAVAEPSNSQFKELT
jgi:hypothetical protein